MNIAEWQKPPEGAVTLHLYYVDHSSVFCFPSFARRTYGEYKAATSFTGVEYSVHQQSFCQQELLPAYICIVHERPKVQKREAQCPSGHPWLSPALKRPWAANPVPEGSFESIRLGLPSALRTWQMRPVGLDSRGRRSEILRVLFRSAAATGSPSGARVVVIEF